MAVKNACLFQILPFTDPKNLSCVKRTFFSRINGVTKETFNTFLLSAIVWYTFKQKPRDVDVFLACLLSCTFEVSS